MGMPLPASFYTADMVRALPDDGKRYEAVHGELLVTPAPRPVHQRVLGRLYFALEQFLRAHPVGELLSSPADISWSEDTLVQPDLFVVHPEEAGAREWTGIQRLLLVVEVASPSTARADRYTKRRLYQEVGIPLYWWVDAEARLVEIWTPEALFPNEQREFLLWTPPGANAAFRLPLAELFRGL
jgi:Uma2 family endonuclease